MTDFGHAVGDGLLQQAAARIRSCLRANDLVARLGGDEFTVMLPKSEISKTSNALHSASSLLSRTPTRSAASRPSRQRVLGVTLHPRDGSWTSRPCCATPTRRCTRPSAQVGTASKSLPPSFNSRRRPAPASSTICTARSPTTKSSSTTSRSSTSNPGRVIKAEALARWRHPETRQRSAERVHPDRRGDRAYRRDRRLGVSPRRDAGAPLAQRLRSAVPDQRQRLAGALATADGAAANFDRLVARPGLGPGAMIIEITENVLIDATDTLRNLFARYRKAGIGIALMISAPAIRRSPTSRISTSATSRPIAPLSPALPSARVTVRSSRRSS